MSAVEVFIGFRTFSLVIIFQILLKFALLLSSSVARRAGGYSPPLARIKKKKKKEKTRFQRTYAVCL